MLNIEIIQFSQQLKCCFDNDLDKILHPDVLWTLILFEYNKGNLKKSLGIIAVCYADSLIVLLLLCQSTYFQRCRINHLKRI